MKSNYKRIRLGNYIERITRRNTEQKYGIDDVRGVTNTKKFAKTRANLLGRTFEKFYIVKPKEFVFNRRTTRMGERFGLGYNEYDREYIFTEDYVPFRINDEALSLLMPEYLYLFFCRDEFDRYVRYQSAGSATEFFNWEDMCTVELPVPPLEKQAAIVRQYKTIADRIVLKQRINDNLTKVEKNCFEHFFTDFSYQDIHQLKDTKLGLIPATWNIGKLCDVCELLNGRAYSQDELLSSGKYRVLRVGNFFTQGKWYYSDMELEDNKYCYPDDLLFCWSASFGLYIWNDIKTIYHYHIWKVDFEKSSKEYREYIYLLLKQEVERLKHEGHGSVMAHLTKEGVENLDIILPPKEVVLQFHNKIFPLIEQQKLIEKELAKLKKFQGIILSHMSELSR